VTASVPFALSAPLQALLAVQFVALLEDQVSVALCPSVIEVGATEMLTVSGGLFTITTADAVKPPPGPVHIRV
jgi:hypothetical protein